VLRLTEIVRAKELSEPPRDRQVFWLCEVRTESRKLIPIILVFKAQYYGDADKSLARAGRKQATAT